MSVGVWEVERESGAECRSVGGAFDGRTEVGGAGVYRSLSPSLGGLGIYCLKSARWEDQAIQSWKREVPGR